MSPYKYPLTEEQRQKRNAASRKHYHAHKTEVSQYYSEWRQANKKKCVDYTRKWLAVHPEKVEEYRATRKEKYKPALNRKHNLKKLYGMTVETYEAIKEAQGGVCAICNEPPMGKRAHLFVDHNHTTGKYRGLLCSKCNAALERFEKYPDYADRALAYLTKYLDRLVRS
jgi:hypothetical protein